MTGLAGEVLASNVHQHHDEHRVGVWDEPDALGDIAFFAGLLGLMAGLLAVIRLSGTHFPDALFWRALPLLLTVPPAMFLAVLYAPGGPVDEDGWSRAARLGLGGLASYVVPLLLLSIAAAAAGAR